eukprot:83163-Rhodomonas_salina.2
MPKCRYRTAAGGGVGWGLISTWELSGHQFSWSCCDFFSSLLDDVSAQSRTEQFFLLGFAMGWYSLCAKMHLAPSS